LVIGTSLPLAASVKVTDKPAPPANPKMGSKGIRSTYAPEASAQAQAENLASSSVVPQTSRKASRSSNLAAKTTTKKPFLVVCPKGLLPRVDQTPTPFHAAAKLGRLARVTAYWAGEGDYYTGRCISSTGVRLHDGHCAVDPNIIPYGSVVVIAGVGKFLAVDTGSAVISRTAAREGGHTSAERSAIVVDLFFEDADQGERFAAGAAKFVPISWWTPTATGSEAKAARDLFAEENWSKIQSKQL
jgi:3D (Asp-Asp-Asp) domain-containing protein